MHGGNDDDDGNHDDDGGGQNVRQWSGESPAADIAKIKMALPLFKSVDGADSVDGEDDGSQRRFSLWLESAVSRAMDTSN